MRNKGDTLKLILNYTLNDTPIAEKKFDEIELQLNSQVNRNSVKLLQSLGEIKYDKLTEKYVCYLSQAQTFKLKQDALNEDSDVDYQIRLLNNGGVVSSDVGTFTLGAVLSKRILTGGNT